jgi:hypothetical protein
MENFKLTIPELWLDKPDVYRETTRKGDDLLEQIRAFVDEDPHLSSTIL